MACVRFDPPERNPEPVRQEDALLPRRVAPPRVVAPSPLDRPALRAHPRVEAERVASAIEDVIGGKTRGVSRRGFLQGMGAASTVALAGGYVLNIAAPERADALRAAGTGPVLPPG